MTQDMLAQRLKYLIMSTTSAIYTAKTSGDYGATFITDNVRQLTGYAPNEFIEDSSFWIDHVHPEDSPRILGELPRLFEHGGYTYEYRFLHKDGTYRWIRDEMKLVADESGNPIEIVGFWIDITERVRMEGALRESEERYRRLLNSVTDYIYTVKVANGRAVATFHGPGCAAVTGYTSEEYTADPYLWYRMVYDEDRPAVAEQVDRVLSGQTVLPLEHRIVHRDGSIRWVRNTSVPHYDGQCLVAYDGLIADITERKQAEEALRASEERYRQSVENSPNAIFSVDREGIIRTWNRACEKTFQYGVEEIVGRLYHNLLWNPEDRSAVEAMVARVWQGHSQSSQDLTYRCKDGAPRFTASRLYPLRGQGGEVQECVFANTDITERVQAEKALRESEAALRSIFRAAPIGIGVVSNRIIKQVNARFCEMVGYSSDELLEQSARIVYPSDEEFEWVGTEKYAQIREGGTGAVETHWRRKGGSIIDVWLSSALLNPSDPSAGVTFTALDITERKRTEEEIRRRNRELALLNRVIAATAASFEPEAVLEIACRELGQAFDVPQAAAALLNEEGTRAVVVAEYCGEDRPTALGEIIPVEGNPSFQYLLTHKVPLVVDDAQTDPRLAPIHELMHRRGTVSLLLLPLIIEGEVVGSLGLDAVEPRHFSLEEVSLAWSVADQLAGALARARLAQARQRLITAIEQAAEGVLITDIQGIILYVNPAFERITGRARAETIGQTVWTLVGDKQDTTIYEQAWATLRAGETWQGRFLNKEEDGTPYAEDATAAPVRDEGGAIVSYVAVIRDITHELQLEEQYRQAQKMEVVGRLTAGIAHDFNNLLTAINGFAELMHLQLPPDDPLQETAGKILGSGQRAADLVRQLLAFSRKQIIEPQVLDLNKVVGDMDTMLRRIIGEHIELKVCLASDLWPVKVDPVQIEQVIVNLVVNARDAMPTGGHLTVETANAVLDEEFVARHLEARPGQYVLLAISDDGIGMSDEVKAHLFEPFFTTKEVGKGTGLGLATVFGIVKQSGGDIWVYSEEGQGTTFKIYLPRVQEMAALLYRSDRVSDLPRGTETVLLVEDDMTVRELINRVLVQQGYVVLMAADGPQALALAQQHGGEIQLLLSDVVMPGLSGKVLVEELARLQPALKVLFMSGYTDNTIVHQGVLEPGIAFLQKPFGPADLLRKVRTVLDS